LATTLAANEIQLKYTDKAVEYIAKDGFDAQFGALTYYKELCSARF
jgi:ATP-dependent Clp protease ATP-binding subunit ClpA